ncbi:OmpA/MotB family protein [Desulfohalovibrio reitneri]|uniref:OmpA/MotB family protein n=1 Tax=Desulfohalovibrio reitneri TaxID=1307759 RepID=UPI0004A70AC1|nr:OmpA family protein [Desulfohalovibrio reitneri]
MARKKKKKGGGDDMPTWLITFSDMMTLLLTFFVLLNSMAVIDERRKLVALGSIIGTFGMGSESIDVLTKAQTRKTVEPGPMEDVEDLQMLKEMVWDDAEKDLRFAESRFVQIFSVSSDVLFPPGETELTGRGRELLNRILPVLRQVDYPLLLAGHTATLRDELGEEFRVRDLRATVDPSWRISLLRTLAVYQYLIGNGMDPAMLRMEAFGRYRPRHDNETPEGRGANRRVDIVLDKRQEALRAEISRRLPPGGGDAGRYEVDGFVFSVGGNRTEGGQPVGEGAP